MNTGNDSLSLLEWLKIAGLLFMVFIGFPVLFVSIHMLFGAPAVIQTPWW